MSVQLADIVMFLALDLDLLVHLRCAPGHSAYNPAERAMSPLNYALQNVSLMHSAGSETFEKMMKNMTTMKKLRQKAQTNPDVKDDYMKSLEPVHDMLKQRFQMVMWQGKHPILQSAATQDEIDSMNKLINIIDPDVEDITTVKKLSNYPTLQNFFASHCRCRQYVFQVCVLIFAICRSPVAKTVLTF